jgi:hypothetical protein
MIKIADKVWAVIHRDRGPLAYMCQVTEKADGTPDAATERMMGTGRSWAKSGPIGEQQGGTEAFYENKPTTGFYIGDVSCRWHTDNKVFNVIDPRGFQVQVPTGNIATLLHHCTVVNGVVQEECVWGREGGSHILLPVNSEPYTEARKLITKVESGMLKPADLTIGDRVKLFKQGDEGKTKYEYFGTVKLSWLRQSTLNTYGPNEANRHAYWYSRQFTALLASDTLEDQIIRDDKWVSVFGYPVDSYDYTVRDQTEREKTRYTYTSLSMELNPKITERTPGVPSAPLSPALFAQSKYLRLPDRVQKQFRFQDEKYEQGKEKRILCTDSVSTIEFKPTKKS